MGAGHAGRLTTNRLSGSLRTDERQRVRVTAVAGQHRRMADGPHWSIGTVNGRSGILVRDGDTVVGTIDLAVGVTATEAQVLEVDGLL